jgi:hypothetical protein
VLQSPRMAMRFYRQMGNSPVPIPDGRSVKFKTLDGQHGFLATEDPALWSAFELCMKQGRSALTEIPWEEFNRDYLLKKNSGQTSAPPWREELVKGQVMPSPSRLNERLSQLPAAAVASPPPAPVPAPAPPPAPMALSQPAVAVNAQIAQALPTAADYKPEVGKRRKAKAT